MTQESLGASVKTLLVDYDNTLHDSDAKFFAKWDGILGLSGQQLWQLYIGVHREIVHRLYPERHDDADFQCRLIFERLGRPYDRTVAERIVRGYREAEEACWKDPTPFPDAIAFLDTVKARGYQLCLATGEHAQEKAQAMDRLGSKQYFDYIFEEDRVGRIKADPEYYRRVLAACQAAPEEATMVGDSLPNDIIPAQAVGITTIWVNRQREDASPRTRPDHTVHSLTEALKYL